MHFAHGLCAWVLRNALRALAVCTLPALAQRADNQKKSVGLNALIVFLIFVQLAMAPLAPTHFQKYLFHGVHLW